METGQNNMTKPANNNKIDLNSNNRLSVQVSLNGLSFLIENEESGTSLFEKQIDFAEMLNPDNVLNEIENAYNQFEVLHSPIKEVTVIHQNTLFSLVPKALFQEDYLEDYLTLNSRLLSSDYVTFDAPEAHEFVVVYVPLTNVNNYFFDKYGSFNYFHSSTVFIEKTLSQKHNDHTLKMFVKLYKGQMDVLVTSGKKIQLFNSFHYTTPEDFIYYILFIAEQLQLNPETFQLQLSGCISKENSFYKIAYTYIRNVTVEIKKNTNSLYIL